MGTSDESDEQYPLLPLPNQAGQLSVSPTLKEKAKQAKYIIFFIYIFNFLILDALRGGEPQDPLERCKYQMVSSISAIISHFLMLSTMFWFSGTQWAMKTDNKGRRRITLNAVVVLVTFIVLLGVFTYELWTAYVKFVGMGGRIEEFLPFLPLNSSR